MTDYEKRRDEAATAYADKAFANVHNKAPHSWIRADFKAGADWGVEQGRAEREAAQNFEMYQDARASYRHERDGVERLTAEVDEWRAEAHKQMDWLHAEQDETKRLKAELAKRQGEPVDQTDNFRLHVGEPASAASPREFEFEIRLRKDGERWVVWKGDPIIDGIPGNYHVIEKSAYDALVISNQKLKDHIKNATRLAKKLKAENAELIGQFQAWAVSLNEAAKERDAAREMAEKLAAALKWIRFWARVPRGLNNENKALDALAEYEKMKGEK